MPDSPVRSTFGRRKAPVDHEASGRALYAAARVEDRRQQAEIDAEMRRRRGEKPQRRAEPDDAGEPLFDVEEAYDHLVREDLRRFLRRRHKEDGNTGTETSWFGRLFSGDGADGDGGGDGAGGD